MGDGRSDGAGQERAAEQEARVEDSEIIESTEEEVQPRKHLKTPLLPTQSQLEEHRVDHLPYRSWCPECVEGFGREDAHTSHQDQAKWVPVVSCDYLFLSAHGVFMRKDWTPWKGKNH